MKKIAVVLATVGICVFGPSGVSLADDYNSCLRDAAQDAARCKYERFDTDISCRDLYIATIDMCRDAYHKWGRR